MRNRFNQSERRLEQVRGDYAVLGEEFQKLEKEVHEVPALRRALDDALGEQARLQHELDQHRQASGQASETEEGLLENVRQLKEARDNQAKVIAQHKTEVEEAMDLFHTAEKERTDLQVTEREQHHMTHDRHRLRSIGC